MRRRQRTEPIQLLALTSSRCSSSSSRNAVRELIWNVPQIRTHANNTLLYTYIEYTMHCECRATPTPRSQSALNQPSCDTTRRASSSSSSSRAQTISRVGVECARVCRLPAPALAYTLVVSECVRVCVCESHYVLERALECVCDLKTPY